MINLRLYGQDKLMNYCLNLLICLIGMIFIIKAVSIDFYCELKEEVLINIFSNLFCDERLTFVNIFDLLSLFFLYLFRAILFSYDFGKELLQ